ncbi:hypothetical protein EsH8_V_001106 [Colletotrichum jinshuiense]
MGLRQNSAALAARSETFVGGDYQIQSHKVSDDYLDVYVVTDTAGARFEAQAFAPAAEMPRERDGLCKARRRRMKRICCSSNFAGEFEHDGRRFLVSKVQRNDKEWMDLQAQVGGRVKSENMPLPTETHIKKGDNLAATDTGMEEQHRRPSYAEAVARKTECPTLNPPIERQKMCLSLTGPK